MKVGFTCGCFDALHSGHRHLLREAARQCDYLIVAVNDDNYCKRKGVGRPICTLEDRMWAINAYGETVGGHFSVIPFDGNDTLLAAFIKPDVVFRGHDQSETCGTIPVIRIGKGEQISTTVLVKSHTRSILK